MERRGLSPRVWGSPGASSRVRHSLRSIPTCVGQPPIQGVSHRLEEVYPHVCGAAAGNIRMAISTLGLSPRVWGSLLRGLTPGIPDGSIPTCVGQPRKMSPRPSKQAVYPHVCGAATFPHCPMTNAPGLSPRVWGSQRQEHEDDKQQGSIPTCVGQPTIISVIRNTAAVYPHVCGAAPYRHEPPAFHRGLSPRVWGSQTICKPGPAYQGSIPTCVGQPRTVTLRQIVPWVYPHVCGAALLAIAIFLRLPGLSPRVWGSPRLMRRSTCPLRSIPTCVGQPRPGCPSSPGGPVYPHVCGAAQPTWWGGGQGQGLSPRVWGSLHVLLLVLIAVGSIPTCVGQPALSPCLAEKQQVYPHVCGAASTRPRHCRSL